MRLADAVATFLESAMISLRRSDWGQSYGRFVANQIRGTTREGEPGLFTFATFLIFLNCEYSNRTIDWVWRMMRGGGGLSFLSCSLGLTIFRQSLARFSKCFHKARAYPTKTLVLITWHCYVQIVSFDVGYSVFSDKRAGRFCVKFRQNAPRGSSIYVERPQQIVLSFKQWQTSTSKVSVLIVSVVFPKFRSSYKE